MEIDIVTYTQNKIKELESIKESAKFYQENEDLVTLSLDELFSRTNIYPSLIPVDFILSFHNSSSARKLYVFDCLDIRDTKRVYPAGMSVEAYLSFVDIVNESLATIGLSVDMKMTDEQREYFDKLVCAREEDPDNHEVMGYDYWYRLVSNIVLASVPDIARSFLQRKHVAILNNVAESVMNNCGGRRQENATVRRYIEEYLTGNNLRISDLRRFDYEEIELERRNKTRSNKRR